VSSTSTWARGACSGNIVVRASHFGLIPLMVADSLLVLTTGRLFCSPLSPTRCRCVVVRCPVPFPPLNYYQLWHDLTHQAPAPLRWLREQVRESPRCSWARAPRCRGARIGAVMTQRLAIRGDLLDITADPGFADLVTSEGALRCRPLAADRGRPHRRPQRHRSRRGVAAPRPPGGALVTPGMIDTHVHSPQLDVIASHGAQLLDWLNTYTFPAERRHSDPVVAAAGAAQFLDALLAHGTTAAAVFPTVHKTSVDALFEAAQARQMRIIAGKVLMDRHAPDGLRDDVAQAERDCVDLIDRWHGRGRLAYAVTPRFAPTSTPAQLSMAGALLAAHGGTYLQTHVAENRDEVRWVAELFPQCTQLPRCLPQPWLA
jgi:hypothetical protein